jgi:formylglycine-generating enzyme required for sulfatase activity
MAKITGRMPGARQTMIHADRGTGRANLAEVPTVGVGETVITDTNQPFAGLATYNDNSKDSAAPIPKPVSEPRARGILFRESVSSKSKSKTPMIAGVAVVALLTIFVSYWLITNPPAPDTNGPPLPVGMISVPGGEFLMGRNDGSDYEKPAHPVKVDPFFIDKNEVTNAEYAEFVRQKRRQPPRHWVDGVYAPGEATTPVVNVNWYDARDYCEWKGRRLPTEEEWEFAARGKENLLYPYGNVWKPQFSNAGESGLGRPRAVGSYPAGASPFNVLDMAGNVAEWTASDYKPYPKSPARPQDGQKIIRGGSFANPAREQTATDRYFDFPNRTFDFIGFRCAKNVK